MLWSCVLVYKQQASFNILMNELDKKTRILYDSAAVLVEPWLRERDGNQLPSEIYLHGGNFDEREFLCRVMQMTLDGLGKKVSVSHGELPKEEPRREYEINLNYYFGSESAKLVASLAGF
jgi:hypothetical protein